MIDLTYLFDIIIKNSDVNEVYVKKEKGASFCLNNQEFISWKVKIQIIDYKELIKNNNTIEPNFTFHINS